MFKSNDPHTYCPFIYIWSKGATAPAPLTTNECEDP